MGQLVVNQAVVRFKAEAFERDDGLISLPSRNASNPCNW
jgi:hypothetical protein